MAFSNLIAFFIMLTAAVTLHQAGITNIDTSAKAAEALRPIAGNFAFLLFAAGIVGTGLLAMPVAADGETRAGRRYLDDSGQAGRRYWYAAPVTAPAARTPFATH